MTGLRYGTADGARYGTTDGDGMLNCRLWRAER